MLIVAIPKSASSSLLKTLGSLHNIEGIQDFSFSSNNIPKNCNIVYSIHSDIRELKKSEVDRFCDSNTFFKQHIFPSKNNLDLLHNKKKVILLRDPDDIIKSYLRGAKYNFNSLPNDFNLKMSNKQFVKKAKKVGLYADVRFFYDQWYSKADRETTLIIDYKEYIRNTKVVINKIENFFDLEITNSPIKPIKARYAKISLLTKFKAKLKVVIVKVMRIFSIKN